MNKQILDLPYVGDTTLKFGIYIKGNIPNYFAVTLLDGGCSACQRILLNWKKTISDHQIPINRIVFIGYDATLTQLEFVKNQVAQKDFVMFLDPQYHFGTLNQIGQDSDDKIMLVDRQWHIITAKDPFKDPETMKLFLTYLKQ